MQPQVQQMIEKLEHLSPERLSEVEDFIDFLQQRERDQLLRKEYTVASNTSFARVWDNTDDAVYDKL